MEKYQQIKGSRILLTGSTGMIGRCVVRRVAELNEYMGIDVKVVAHCRSRDKFNEVFGGDSYKFIEPLVCDVRQLEYESQIDYVIHAAGVTGGSLQHLNRPIETLSVALEGTKRCLDLAVSKGCAGFVYLSSLEVYGTLNSHAERIGESFGNNVDTMNPRSSYSEGKRAGETLIAAYSKQLGLRGMVVRLTSSFGYGVSSTDNRVFAQFAKSVLKGEDIVLKSTGGTTRGYCDTMDVAEAILCLLERGKAGEAYNVSNMDCEVTIRELAERFISFSTSPRQELRFDLKQDPTKLGYNPEMRCVLDSRKLMALGWKPKYDLDDMIEHLLTSMEHEIGVSRLDE